MASRVSGRLLLPGEALPGPLLKKAGDSELIVSWRIAAPGDPLW